MPEPSIAAVILNYNQYEDTIECLRSLLLSSYQFAQIVVVDNASTDGSEEKLKKEFPSVTLLQTGKNLGYAGGMNAGIRHALQLSPEYIFIANGDTTIEREAILYLVSALKQNSQSAAASGTIYKYPDKKNIWYAGGNINYWRASAFTRHTLPPPPIVSQDYAESVTFVSGCVFLVRATALHQTGLFDKRFFMYIEDVELCSRFLSKGLSVFYAPNAVIYHKAEDAELQPFRLYFMTRNRLLFLKLAPPNISKYFGFLYFFFSYFMKMLFWGIVKPNLFQSAWQGIVDFFVGNFYEGRGLTFVSNEINNNRT